MTPQAFGQQLRRQREERGITLPQVAERTKVPLRLLRSLEEGKCFRWPGGIYSRGYVRAYALTIAMDPEETVSTFTRCYPEFAPEGAPAPPEAMPAVETTIERLKDAVAALARTRRGVSA